MARTSPGEFLRQVRAETAKVVWPTRKETMTTAIMVVIMTTLLGLFFFATPVFGSESGERDDRRAEPRISSYWRFRATQGAFHKPNQ